MFGFKIEAKLQKTFTSLIARLAEDLFGSKILLGVGLLGVVCKQMGKKRPLFSEFPMHGIPSSQGQRPADVDMHERLIESWAESPKRRDRKSLYPLHQSVHWKHLGCD